MNHINCSLDFASKQQLPKPKKHLKFHFSWRRVLRGVMKSLTVAVLILSLQIPYSLSFFWDSEISTGNVFAAGELDMGFSSLQSSFDPIGILKGASSTYSAKVSNLSGLPFKYKLGISALDPANELCNNLSLKVWYYRYSAPDVLDKTLKYSGSLSSFLINADGTDPVMMISNDQPYIPNSDYSENEHWYWYEVALPADADPSLGSSTCGVSLTAEAVQTNMDWQNGFWDIETLASSISTGTWAKVSGMKWHDVDKDGVKDADEAGLSDWTIFAGKQFDQFTVSSDGTVSESKILANGKKYVIRASGFIQNGTDLRSDAKYADKSPYDENWTDTVPGYEGNGATFLDLQIDGNTPEWGVYQTDHEYWTTYVGEDAVLTFDINDQVISENSGNLQITIFEVVASDITDGQGLYEIDLSGISGQFIVGEEQKVSWMQTYPVKGFHTFTDPAIYINKDFGNVEVPPTPDHVKLVINEVYYDVAPDKGNDGGSQSDEWVELYNPNDFEINLKDWTIQDNGSTAGDRVTLSHSAKYIPAHGFAVLAKAAQTWGYWSIPSGASTIELGHEIGNGLSNSGDRLILRNPDGEIIDQISYGSDVTIHNPAITGVAQGHSIARQTAGLDTDQASDWVDLKIPNPGTNPHSHIQVNLNQEANNLLLSFSNATGFDLVKYLITYSHLYAGTYIQEAIVGEKTKLLDETLLILNPFYLGTCSSLGEVCVPHYGVKDLNINLEYFDGDYTLGTSDILYNWK